MLVVYALIHSRNSIDHGGDNNAPQPFPQIRRLFFFLAKRRVTDRKRTTKADDLEYIVTGKGGFYGYNMSTQVTPERTPVVIILGNKLSSCPEHTVEYGTRTMALKKRRPARMCWCKRAVT